jgi:hypothetical protein
LFVMGGSDGEAVSVPAGPAVQLRALSLAVPVSRYQVRTFSAVTETSTCTLFVVSSPDDCPRVVPP